MLFVFVDAINKRICLFMFVCCMLLRTVVRVIVMHVCVCVCVVVLCVCVCMLVLSFENDFMDCDSIVS